MRITANNGNRIRSDCRNHLSLSKVGRGGIYDEDLMFDKDYEMNKNQ